MVNYLSPDITREFQEERENMLEKCESDSSGYQNRDVNISYLTSDRLVTSVVDEVVQMEDRRIKNQKTLQLSKAFCLGRCLCYNSQRNNNY